MTPTSARIPVLYLAPWVDFGGSDRGTIDWFRWLDRDRFAPTLVTTQPSPNRRLGEVVAFAEEVWPLPDLMAGNDMPRFICDHVHSRRVQFVQVMNSRLGYELLPDLAALPRPPRLVVQLHVEEPDRMGYVRYVTTRFGNLVHGFSVSSEHLARAVEGYGVARERISVIRTGVDAEGEFDPTRVTPQPGINSGRTQVLFAGRLVEQKDPQLMLDVVGALARRRRDFQVQVVGDGHLEPDVRNRIDAEGLGDVIRLHPPVRALAPWYAACDALLMTSAFEGVPYVLYEAMAMALPSVVPALAGNRELLPEGAGVLIDPRDDVDAYVEALDAICADAERARAMGERARRHVLAELSLRHMAEQHERLYERIGAPAAPPRTAMRSDARDTCATGPLRLASRPIGGTAKVSVVIPCFNHGSWLRECVESIRNQTYGHLETIVVDDASTTDETAEALAELEGAPDVEVVRLRENSGPSVARNRGIERATGRYVLPVDADNVLLPNAVADLVRSLESSGEKVGYVYQNLQYFGNREDYFEPSSFNLYELLQQNYIDTSALIDRDVFDKGYRFAEDIRLGHEDWDFFLNLAAAGIVGEVVRSKTLLYRKHGFTRSDSVEHAADSFTSIVAERHPSLFGNEGRVDAKAHWAPALSLVFPRAIDTSTAAWLDALARVRRQHCRDFEMIVVSHSEPVPDPHDPPIRFVSARLETGDAFVEAVRRARGRHVLISDARPRDILRDAGSAEGLLRVLGNGSGSDAIALATTANPAGYPLRWLEEPERDPARVHTLVLAGERLEELGGVELPADGPLAGLLAALTAMRLRIEWRELDATPQRAAIGGRKPVLPVQYASANDRVERERRRAAPAFLPSMPPEGVRRWAEWEWWKPTQRQLLWRHRESGGERRLTTIGPYPPMGYEPEHCLGALHMHSPPGTVRLVVDDGPAYGVIERGGDAPDEMTRRTLGYVEQAAFPCLLPLTASRYAATGEQVLVAGDQDPLAPLTEPFEHLGWIEPWPILPRWPPHVPALIRDPLVGLLRAIDVGRRRHVYATAIAPGSVGVWELGGLLEHDGPDTVPVWLDDDGHVWSGEWAPAAFGASAPDALRWALAPLTWSGVRPASARLRAFARRTALLPSTLRPDEPPPRPDRPPTGWLYHHGRSDRLPLYAAIHPVTGDQLLTRYPEEARETGFGDPRLLGFLVAEAPVTGSLQRPRISIPWASRFGQAIRWGVHS